VENLKDNSDDLGNKNRPVWCLLIPSNSRFYEVYQYPFKPGHLLTNRFYLFSLI
jgi:hypothetical protein